MITDVGAYHAPRSIRQPLAYWQHRYAGALSHAKEARSTATRTAYTELAQHYRSMIECIYRAKLPY